MNIDLATLTPVGQVRRGLYLASGVLVLIVAGFVAWKVFFAGAASKRAVGKAIVAEERADGQTRATEAAMQTLEHASEQRLVITTRVQQGIGHVYAAPEASDTIGAELDLAGRRALCMHDSYRRANDCTGL